MGNYEIRVRMEEAIFEGSEKNLVVFTARRREGVGYEIIPGNRWTRNVTLPGLSMLVSELYYPF